jgi:hypothetical protein
MHNQSQIAQPYKTSRHVVHVEEAKMKHGSHRDAVNHLRCAVTDTCGVRNREIAENQDPGHVRCKLSDKMRTRLNAGVDCGRGLWAWAVRCDQQGEEVFVGELLLGRKGTFQPRNKTVRSGDLKQI